MDRGLWGTESGLDGVVAKITLWEINLNSGKSGGYSVSGLVDRGRYVHNVLMSTRTKSLFLFLLLNLTTA